MALTKQQHLDPTTGVKRILSLDGGGLRGVLSLQYLSVIETMLRKRSGNDNFRLCDYFDLIGGTSTGAIIAAALACGMTVDQVKALYRNLGNSVFRPSILRNGILSAKFPSERVQKALDDNLGAGITLGGDAVRTGLMVMTKRLDSGSPWPLHNHPGGVFAEQDGKLFLSHVVRASTAAPTYFEPERITIHSRNGTETDAAFVDGGVSPFNDPALQLLMLAGLQGHGWHWPLGSDKLLLVSIGTGSLRSRWPTDKIMHMPAAEQGLRSLQSLMDDTGRTNQALLQWLTDCLTPWTIDRAVGDMTLDSRNGPKLATYLRYNVLLEAEWLKKTLDLDKTAAQIEELAVMDKPQSLAPLEELGVRAAARQIAEDHFPARFDLAH